MNLFRRDLPLHLGRATGGPLAVAITLLAAAAGCCFLLWPEWRQNPDLSHGFFAPLIFVLLLAEGRRVGPLRWLRSGTVAPLLQLALLAAAVVIFILACLFAASVGWDHSLVLFLLALCLAALLTAGLGILADEQVRLVPFNWITITAILLWVLVAPIPTGTYARLTLMLQGWVTGGVMDVLQFFGVPARRHGNVIELARLTVGVEEACSGVRSLISCVYAGFFFAAWQVRRPLRRLVLIVAAPLLALAMNFLRSLILTLLANDGVNISGRWHDATGYAILATTAAILAGLAIWLETKDEPAPPAAGLAAAASLSGRFASFWVAVTLIAGLAGFCFANSRPASTAATPPPPLEQLLPATAPGWEVHTPSDLFQFSGILGTNQLLQRTYWRAGTGAGGVDLTIYIAYWPPGEASVSRVASHTPDACWPGSGWFNQTNVARHREAPAFAGFPLAPGEYRLFKSERGAQQHVWFWHVYDGQAIGYRDPYSLPALLEIAWHYGFRRQGSQYFIRVSSSRPWEEISREPLLQEILTNLHPIGL